MKFFASAIAAATLSTAMAFSATPAGAVTCSVNIEQAYQRAVANGWRFSCLKGVITFNGQKRIGCTVKTGASPSVRATIYLFRKGRTTFHGGWSLAGFKMSGGQFEKHDPRASQGIVRLSFNAKGPFRTARRYLSELKLKKNGGSCANVLNEAF